MLDLLFIEFGAVVAEVAGPSRCTVEIYCDPKDSPTYDAGSRVPIDFAYLLDDVIRGHGWLTLGIAAGSAQYDLIPGHGSPPIGPGWPGGGYEGIVSVRADLVQANPILAAAVGKHPGKPYEYEVVASLDPGGVSRYHGFHAEIVGTNRGVLELMVADAGTSANPKAHRTRVLYDPSNTKTFYTGAVVAEKLVGNGHAGAVYISPDAAAGMGMSLPKLPPSAGL